VVTDAEGTRITSVDNTGNMSRTYYRRDPATGEVIRDPLSGQAAESWVVGSNG
jgi:hypothetical protein